MFFEVTNIKGEKLLINENLIEAITPTQTGGCIIFSSGNRLTTAETYKELSNKVNDVRIVRQAYEAMRKAL